MCYFLYGSLYGDVAEDEYRSVLDKYKYKITLGTKHDVKLAVKAAASIVEDKYRITDGVCDCDSAVGRHDPNDPEIQELRELILDLSTLSGAKQINICKTWTGRQNKREIKVNLGDIDVSELLANLHENCLYSIEISDDAKIDLVAARILMKHRPAFEELAK